MKKAEKKCNQLGKGTAPGCTHDECWFTYFMQWPAVPRVIMRSIRQYGKEAVIAEYGEKHVKRVIRFMEGRKKGGASVG